jgi:hypothetical protein
VEEQFGARHHLPYDDPCPAIRLALERCLHHVSRRSPAERARLLIRAACLGLIVSAAVVASCGNSDTYYFATVTSPDSEIEATWRQNAKRGDDRWLEDCVELVRLTLQPLRETNCSFVGITGDNLKMKWPTRRHLEITYPPSTKVVKAETKWNDVTITYAEDPRLQKY